MTVRRFRGQGDETEWGRLRDKRFVSPVEGLTRGQLVRRAAAFGVSISALPALAAACGGDGDDVAQPATSTPGDTAPQAGGELTFSSWGGEYSNGWKTAVTDKFTEETGTVVIYDDAPAEHIASLQAQNQSGNVLWDLVEAAPQDYPTMVENDLLQPLPEDLRQLAEELSFPGGVIEFGIASGAGAGQILVCGPTVERCPESPADFWDVGSFPGPRGMWKDGFIDNVVSALLADGVSKEALFPLDLDRAYRKLDEIRPHIDVYWASGDQQQQILRDREVDMLFGWDGRAWNLKDEGLDVAIHYEGGIVTSNFVCVVNRAPNPDGAFALLEWYATHPEAQAEWVEANGYAPPHKDLASFLDQDLSQTLWTNYEDQVIVLDVNDLSADEKEELNQRWYDWLEG